MNNAPRITHPISDLRIYCTACGAKRKASERCPFCGALSDELRFQGIPRVGAAGIGYSQKTDDPSFGKSTRKSRTASLTGALVIGVIAAVVSLLPFRGNPVPGLIIGGIVFVAAAIPALLSTRTKRSWEGNVEKKEIIEKAIHSGSGSDRLDHHEHRYKITFRTVGGKRKVWSTDSVYTNVFDYLEEGDRVRYIGKLKSKCAFEKYDKSADDVLMCASCSNFQDPRAAYCAACGSRLLKGNPIL